MCRSSRVFVRGLLGLHIVQFVNMKKQYGHFILYRVPVTTPNIPICIPIVLGFFPWLDKTKFGMHSSTCMGSTRHPGSTVCGTRDIWKGGWLEVSYSTGLGSLAKNIERIGTSQFKRYFGPHHDNQKNIYKHNALPQQQAVLHKTNGILSHAPSPPLAKRPSNAPSLACLGRRQT